MTSTVHINVEVNIFPVHAVLCPYSNLFLHACTILGLGLQKTNYGCGQFA